MASTWLALEAREFGGLGSVICDGAHAHPAAHVEDTLGTITIRYVPAERLLEQKALRDFLTGFRERDILDEEDANAILDGVVAELPLGTDGGELGENELDPIGPIGIAVLDRLDHRREPSGGTDSRSSRSTMTDPYSLLRPA